MIHINFVVTELIKYFLYFVITGAVMSFCEVSLGSQVHRTSIANSANPKWDSSMQFHIKSLAEDVLCITVYEKGYFKPNGLFLLFFKLID